MDAYLQIKKLHSDKKDKDYTATILYLGGREYYINIPLEAQSIILDKSLRDVLSLESGFCSDKFDIDLK